ncbi:MAG: hypothetical protein AAGG79_00655 [Pseudomonadota bacterium]
MDGSRRSLLSALASLTLVGACVSEAVEGQRTEPARPAPRAAVDFNDTEAPDPSPLDGFGIPSGRCGMVLWSPSGGRIAPIFRSVDVTTASMRLEDRDVALRLVEQAGALRLGMRARQTFATLEGSASSYRVLVDADWGDPFPGGLYVEGGSVTITGSDGWTRIMPIAGIAGCKS